MVVLHSTSSVAASAEIDTVARTLPYRAALLARLLLRRLAPDVSRSEGGVLVTLAGGPRRITELGELEGLAQPTMTLLVKQLEERGWVVRERDTHDGRVVLVSLTDAGRAKLEELQRQSETILGEYVSALDEEQVRALVAATEALEPLIAVLQLEPT